MLAALLERRPIDDKVALVVAHPDDETLAAGGSLHLFRHLLLIHVTDGAPLALGDAAREGFESPAAYAAARGAELDAALALADTARVTRLALGVSDQAATAALREIAAWLREIFAIHAIQAVLTHSYEGGHPDHDAVARAVALTGAETYEFSGYHADPSGAMRTGAFLSDRSADEIAVPLQADDLARKRAMLACFHTQREILGQFDPGIERFRRAPRYDFEQPPHPGRLLYEQWGWMSGDAWRERVRCSA